MATTLEIILQAKDEASKDLKSISQTAVSMGKTFGIAGGAITGALGLAVKSAAEAQGQMARFNVILKNSAGATDDVKKSLLEASKSATQFGFDNEAAAVSLARFFQRTGDAAVSTELLKTTMDLAAAKGLDLGAATDKLNLFLAGSPKLLKEIGVELSETATESEKFRAIQAALAGQAEASAKTLEGSFRVLREEFGEVVESIGDALIPAIQGLIENVRPIIATIGKWIETHPELSKKILLVVAGLGVLMLAMSPILLLMPQIIATIGVLQGAFLALKAAAIASQMSMLAFSAASGGLVIAIAFLGVVLAKLLFSFMEFADSVGGAGNALELFSLSVKENLLRLIGMDEAADRTRAQFDSLAVAFQTLAQETNKNKGAASDLGGEFAKIAAGEGPNYAAALDKAKFSTEDLAKKTAEVNKQIRDLQRQLTAAIEGENRRQADSKAELATQIVEQEQKVTDLMAELDQKKKDNAERLAQESVNISGATEFKKLQETQARLQQEELALATKLSNEQRALLLARDLEKGLISEVQEAKRVAALTDFERFVEDNKKRNELAVIEFNDRVLRIKEEILEVQKKNIEILKAETTTGQGIKKVHEGLTQDIKTQAEIQKNEVGVRLTQMGKDHDALRQRLATPIVIPPPVQAPSPGLFGRVKGFLGLQKGGIVTKPTAALIGEKEPEAVIPLSRIGKEGRPINITITGNSFMSDEQAAIKIGDMIVGRLKLVSRIGL